MGQSITTYKVSTTKKIMALTFDDGSDGANLSKELDILASSNVKCTFFLTGKASEAHPSLIRKIVEQGHEIGNHSYSHPEFTLITAGAMKTELLKAENSIINITGVNPKPLFRPPYGSFNSTVLNAAGEIGYTNTIMWSIDTVDWAGAPAKDMIEKVLNQAQPGAIAIMHTGGGTHTTEALPEMISGLKLKGYSLTTVSKLLSESEPVRPLLRKGSRGVLVEELQEMLTRLGFNPGPIDGNFGSFTEAAVKSFQKSKNLTADGIVGPRTWSALDDALEALPPVEHPVLRKGSSGESVVYLQQRLRKLGFDSGPIDGIFGSRTEGAVKLFQASNNLKADGIVGTKTWAALSLAE
jgi:peptidoglycan/xylan/chitin deacetylase (PgdA/CDA1 family)